MSFFSDELLVSQNHLVATIPSWGPEYRVSLSFYVNSLIVPEMTVPYSELLSFTASKQLKARALQMNSDWFPKYSDYFLTTFKGNFPLFSDQSWRKFLPWVTNYCQQRINTHRSLWILIINWNHLLFSAAALIIQLIDWSWWQHRVKNSNTQSKYGDIIHYHVDKSQNFY